MEGEAERNSLARRVRRTFEAGNPSSRLLGIRCFGRREKFFLEVVRDG